MSNFAAQVDAVIEHQATSAAGMNTHSLPDVLEMLYATKYTGPSIVHFHEGRIRIVEIPNPIKVKVT